MREITSLLLAVHIICMSVTATVPLLTVWFEHCEGRGDYVAGVVGRWLLGAALWLFLIGSMLGLTVGWIQWEGGLADALTRLAGKVRYGVLELLFSAVLMLVHWSWWRSVPEASMGWRRMRSVLGLLAGTNLLYHFPVLFAVTSHLIHQGEAIGEAISPSEFRQYIVDPAVGSRVVHIVLASLAACGVAVIACVNFFPVLRDSVENPLAKRKESTSREEARKQEGSLAGGQEPSILEQQRQRFTAWGARIAILPTVAQVPTGLWVFTQLSPLAQGRVLGKDLIAGPLLLLGIASALWLIHLLASLCLGEDNRLLSRRATLVFVLTMILMTLSSRRVMASFPSQRSEKGSDHVGLSASDYAPRFDSQNFGSDSRYPGL
jgi:hypothetical protein